MALFEALHARAKADGNPSGAGLAGAAIYERKYGRLAVMARTCLEAFVLALGEFLEPSAENPSRPSRIKAEDAEHEAIKADRPLFNKCK